MTDTVISHVKVAWPFCSDNILHLHLHLAPNYEFQPWLAKKKDKLEVLSIYNTVI